MKKPSGNTLLFRPQIFSCEFDKDMCKFHNLPVKYFSDLDCKAKVFIIKQLNG